MTYQDVDPEIAARLFEIKKNQLKMVERRGYNIDRERYILQITLPEFLKTYISFARKQNKSFRSILTNIYENEEGKKILVYYADALTSSTQLGVNEIGDAIVYMDKYHLHDAIIITVKQLNPPANKHINGLVAYNIQIFLEAEMAYDPTEHFLVPKHIPLTETEQKEFLENNQIGIDQMPIILSNDIIIKNLGIRSGQIVRIERENMFETMIVKSVTYKVVQ